MRHLETATAENETLNAKVRVGRDEDHPERGLTLLANRPLRAEEVVVSLPRKARVMRAVSEAKRIPAVGKCEGTAKQRCRALVMTQPFIYILIFHRVAA